MKRVIRMMDIKNKHNQVNGMPIEYQYDINNYEYQLIK